LKIRQSKKRRYQRSKRIDLNTEGVGRGEKLRSIKGKLRRFRKE